MSTLAGFVGCKRKKSDLRVKNGREKPSWSGSVNIMKLGKKVVGNQIKQNRGTKLPRAPFRSKNKKEIHFKKN